MSERVLSFTRSHVFPFGLQAGVNAAFATGAPLSILGDSDSGDAMYLQPRGSWGRLPSTPQVHLHVELPSRLGPVTATPLVDVFNLTDAQPATARGQLFNNVPDGNQEPPYTDPTVASFGKDTAWQRPRVVRLGARVSFSRRRGTPGRAGFARPVDKTSATLPQMGAVVTSELQP